MQFKIPNFRWLSYRMNIVKIEENVKQIINKITQNELNQQDFIYELLLAYGHRSQSIELLNY